MIAVAQHSAKSVYPFPMKVLSAAMILTLLLFTGVGWQIWQSYQDFRSTQTRDFPVQELSGKITHLDEVLTMSARMAATTGSLEWEARYERFEPELDAAIKEAMKLAPEVFMSRAAAQTDEANIRLVKMEKRAFDLVRKGDREAASEILFCKEYEEQKQIYSEGIGIITKALEDRTAAALKKQSRRALAATASVAVTFPILILAWLAVLRSARRHVTERNEAEREQAASLDRFRSVMDSLDATVYVADMETYEVLFINRYLREIFGDIEGKLCWQALQTGQKGPCDFCTNDKLVDVDGNPTGVYAWEFQNTANNRWYDCRDQAIQWADGRTVRMEIATDITDRKRAEEALRESEDRYRTLVENSSTCIYVRQGDRFRFVNRRMIEVSGYSGKELLNMSIFDLVHPEDRELARRQAEQRESGHGAEGPLQYRIATKDGGSVWVETVGGIQVDYEGKPAMFSSFIEVTDRKRAEEALNEARDRLDSVLEVAPIILWSVDADGIFLLSEGRSLEALGLKPGEVVGQSVFDLYKDHPELLSMIRRSLSGEDFTGDAEVSGRHWHNRYVPHRNEAGDVIGMFGFSMDITERTEAEEERKKFEAQLQHTQKLESLGILAGGIAHDFNNLLTGILGNADLALLNLAPASPARNNLTEIETAARRAAELCGQMLAYSGKGRFFVEAVSINELVEEMAHLVEISISKKAVLRYDFADNLPAIEADATQIRQIVMNLITNASEAIGEKSGVVSISTGAMECDSAYLTETYLDDQLDEGVYVYLEVSDSGCGMDAETREKIFDPFFTTKFTGRGLGLAAVLGIVRGHRGAIKVYSEPGKGATFKALFPAIERLVAASRKKDSRVAGWRGSGTALLVDDEETVRTIGKLMLEEMGFSVALAVDGRDGVEKFRERRDEIVLVLLDMTMPGMGGEEAFREIRRIDADAAVILSSGYNEQEVTSRFAGKGLAGFIQKPYQYQALLEKVRAALAE